MQTSSKENLELGCGLIKRAVVEKSLIIVQQDKAINDMLEKRRRARQMGMTSFKDDNVTMQREDLPVMLQPNLNGLSDSQFQVYSDFAKLGNNIKP